MPPITEAEFLMLNAFSKIGAPVYPDQVWCFQCKDFFSFDGCNFPSVCKIKKHKFRQGDYALPDFLLVERNPMEYWKRNIGAPPPSQKVRDTWMMLHQKVGVVRIDGKVHEKDRKHKMHDLHQTKKFMEQDAKVFVIKNEEVLGYEQTRNTKKHRVFVSPWVHIAIATYIMKLLEDDILYATYLNIPDIHERFYGQTQTQR